MVKIDVEELFGFLNHSIIFNEEGVTFIHGPNGCGKTTLLKLIESFFHWNLPELFAVKFKLLLFEFSTGETLSVKKKQLTKTEAETIKEISVIDFTLHSDDVETKITIEQNQLIEKEKADLIGFDPDNPPLYDLKKQDPDWKKKPEWLKNILNTVNLHFIETQRLLKVENEGISQFLPSRATVNPVVPLYSFEIRRMISERLAESASISQSKDSSFPERLLSINLNDAISEEKIREDYKQTEEKIKKLIAAGLMEQEKNISLPDKSMEATERKVLALYLQDINEKLSVFDDLQKRMEIFLNIISPKLRNKKFSINRKEGFVFDATQGESGPIDLSLLSSGEQHQIVLFYELIFKTEEGSFLLIDEPEISLHVDWQRQFFSDIAQIAKFGNHTFLVATHSPQIIGSRRDLAIALDGGILNE